jgi:hypothetical protein
MAGDRGDRDMIPIPRVAAIRMPPLLSRYLSPRNCRSRCAVPFSSRNQSIAQVALFLRAPCPGTKGVRCAFRQQAIFHTFPSPGFPSIKDCPYQTESVHLVSRVTDDEATYEDYQRGYRFHQERCSFPRALSGSSRNHETIYLPWGTSGSRRLL